MKQKDFEEYEKRHAELEFELKLAEEALITSKVIGYNFIPVNPWLGRLIGFDAALMLGIIYEKSAYSKHTSGVLEHEIPMSINYVKQITGMGEERQKKAIDILIGHGLIEYWTKGAFPKRRFFSIKTGKYKTASLMVGITLTLFYDMPFELWNVHVSDFLLIVATALSIISGVQYYNMNKKYIFGDSKEM